MVKNSKSAFLALAAAGGLWAWRNRDKVQSWLNSQRGQLTPNTAQTGETRRIGQDQYLNPDLPTGTSTDSYRSEV